VTAYRNEYGELFKRPSRSVQAWACGECGELHAQRGEAAECCNDELREQRRAERAAVKSAAVRARVKAHPPRITLSKQKDYAGRVLKDCEGRVFYTAVASCGYARCVWGVDPNGTKQQARALALAHYARHVAAQHGGER